ncbi:thioredoxin domain-containing protein [Oerskovia flava]|uniref:thioredoxin domain-containing protein n=1 Tax=Oerskovia flava TaxID=2986422 RepID=UPI00223E9403|nr:DUF255 domain-containing protein [Oerskovia sp. JB1-3-2]
MSNRLAGAVSPYLLQHAQNPVDWYPWGEDAFAEARRRDVPVLVSIGYATCHWCHVMARESFADEQVAAYLRERFVAVKVDREEHPDVDASYLAAASAFTRDLGWPLTVFTTPDGRPFYAGTYFPPVPVSGRASFTQVLAAVDEAWTQRRDQIEETGRAVADALASGAAVPEGSGGDAGAVDREALARVVEALEDQEDTELGGFGTAPKFPAAPVLELLLDVAAASVPDDETRRRALALAERSLLAMARGELRDPVEGGFFRYATRRDWSEPHYERMLYDNAQLLSAYTTLAVLTRAQDPGSAIAREAAAVAGGIGDFLTGVLRTPGGAFASAQDSESVVDGQRVEGGYYRLSAAERERQAPPALDEKVLAGWNGLAIEALARAGHHLGRPDLLDAARRAADQLLAEHVRDDGTLVRVTRAGRASAAAATLEDHGALATGLIVLGGLLPSGPGDEAEDSRYLRAGLRLAAGVLERTDEGVRLRTPQGGDPVLAAQGLDQDADPSEGAYPSGPTAAGRAAALAHLATGETAYREAAGSVVAAVAGIALERPLAFGAVLRLGLTLAEPDRQLALVATPPADVALLGAARDWYHPGALVVRATPAGAVRLAAEGVALLDGRGVGAYLCESFVCRLPVTEPDELRAVLAGTGAPAGGRAHDGSGEAGA